jgi:hypothetical protein
VVSTGSEIDRVARLERSLREALAGDRSFAGPTSSARPRAARPSATSTWRSCSPRMRAVRRPWGASSRGSRRPRKGYRSMSSTLASAAPALAGRIAREARVLADREPEAPRSWEVEANARAVAGRVRPSPRRGPPATSRPWVDRDKADRVLGELTGCLADLRRYRERVTRHELNTVRDYDRATTRSTSSAISSASLPSSRHGSGRPGDVAGPPLSASVDLTIEHRRARSCDRRRRHDGG